MNRSNCAGGEFRPICPAHWATLIGSRFGLSVLCPRDGRVSQLHIHVYIDSVELFCCSSCQGVLAIPHNSAQVSNFFLFCGVIDFFLLFPFFFPVNSYPAHSISTCSLVAQG